MNYSEYQIIFVRILFYAKRYLVQTFLYDWFIRLPAGHQKLRPLILNHIKLFLQPIELFLKSLKYVSKLKKTTG